MLNTARDVTTVRASEWPSYKARLRMRARLQDIRYTVSQGRRKLVEESSGWLKTVAGLARTRLVGRWKIRQQMYLAAGAFNPVRMRKLLTA
jgi:hypothetical protein